MTVQASNCSLIGVFNNHRYRGAGGGSRVDITGGVVAFYTAAGLMNGQDFAEVADSMTVGAGLIVCLAAIA